jgi:hypothetical protein
VDFFVNFRELSIQDINFTDPLPRWTRAYFAWRLASILLAQRTNPPKLGIVAGIQIFCSAELA